MNLLSLYSVVERDNISVFNFVIPCKKGMCLKIDCNDCIVINDALLEDEIDEKTVLAEEYGHIKSNALYCYNDYNNPCRLLNIQKAERRAKDQAASTLVPLKELRHISKTMTESYQLAEYFDVSEQTIFQAIDYYKRKGLL